MQKKIKYKLSFQRLVMAVFFISYFSSVKAGEVFPVCKDFHCDVQQQVSLTPSQWSHLEFLFNDNQTALQERESIREAIAYFEDQVGQLTGTWRDRGDNYNGEDLPGQLDCIAESRNTTTYLNLLKNAGFIVHHDILPRERRTSGMFFVHWTAVIKDLDNQKQYAVDSWYLDNGQPPYIQPIKDWMRKKKFADNDIL